MENEIWLRQPNESEQAFSAYKIYLLEHRSCEEVAQRLHKTPNHVRRLKAKYDWERRAAAWDKSIFEEVRGEFRRQVGERLMTQWNSCAELQAAACAALNQKNLASASVRSLNEVFATTANLQHKIIDALKLLEFEEGDADNRQLTVNIVPLDRK